MTGVVVLLSSGRHPASGRARGADLDARALTLALGLADRHPIQGVHAGNEADPALKEYLGLGIPEITVLAQAPGVDVLPVIIEHIRSVKPTLILTGRTAEHGECSGTLPYAVAQALELPLISGISRIVWTDSGVEALLALPRGRRRRVCVTGAAVGTVDITAPAPAQWTFRHAQRGRLINRLAPSGPPDPLPVRVQPARARPTRITAPGTGDPQERLRALLGNGGQNSGSGGEVRSDLSPDEAAEAIWSYLVRERVVMPTEDSR
jgi:electron transfer flavoprotein beta subunit